MKALKACGWFLLVASVCHYLTGIVSGEFHYPSMKAFWLTVMSAACLFFSLAIFIVIAVVKHTRGK